MNEAFQPPEADEAPVIDHVCPACGEHVTYLNAIMQFGLPNRFACRHCRSVLGHEGALGLYWCIIGLWVGVAVVAETYWLTDGGLWQSLLVLVPILWGMALPIVWWIYKTRRLVVLKNKKV